MNISFYEWHKTDPATKRKIMARGQADIDSVLPLVLPIIEDVKNRGDDALIDYALKFDGAALKSIKATETDFAEAEQKLDQELKDAICICVQNVKAFHAEQMRRADQDKQWMMDIAPGIRAGEKITAIPSVGLYVPRGKGAFPSAMYMLCVPAVLAGVQEIAVVTPPTPDGGIDAASLFTARMCGVENIYKAGGAQGIAALAYGTQTIPRVSKVLGPGSPYVAAAKRALSHIIDPGMPAGPSESIILCDGGADPHNTCLDVLNEAEHGKDSAALLVTHDAALAEYVRVHLPAHINALPEPHRGICAHVMGAGYGGIIVTRSLEESIDFANKYAPEHLHLKVKDPEMVLDKILHTGEILIGEDTPSSFGNYGIGVNHVLPTGGWARSYSATGVWDFLKRVSIAQVDAQGAAALRGPVGTLTDYEGFPAHGNAVRLRK